MEQTIGLWLAAQADKDGIVEAVDWLRLVADTGLSETGVRKSLRPQGALIQAGLVNRKRRFMGKGSLPTQYSLIINNIDERPD